ncbi:hypothetical protein ACIRD3_40020 [Kitasatospora sp. NPDC093550]|uniref:hypothetical protein n=1 Tax=Kitasatospora sp. NPDC093550 TaxID=3364089 RepID=UPI0038298E61
MAILAATRDAHSAVSSLAQATPSPGPTTPANGADNGVGKAIADTVGTVLHWLGEKSGLGVLGVVVVIGGLCWAFTQMPKPSASEKAKAKERDEAIGKAFGALGRFVWRIVSGRPLSAAADARKKEAGGTFFEPVPRPVAERQAMAAMASVAIAGPTPAPFDLDAKLAGFQDYLETLAGKVPSLLLTLADWAALGAVWAAVGARWLGRALRGLWVLPRALWRSAATYPRWAHSWVLVLRLATLGGVLLYSAYPGGVQLGAGAVALVAAGFAATGPDGLGYWSPPPPTDEEVYGPALWLAVKVALRLDDEEPREKWLTVPDDFVENGPPIRLELPPAFVGTDRERAALDEVVNSKLPGEWVSTWRLMGGGHHALWTLQPAPVIRDLVGDEARLGPSLWAAVRTTLRLPEKDQLWDWLTIPASVADRAAEIRLELPPEFVGHDAERAGLDALVNSRIPGDWVSRWHLMEGPHYAVWTHRPPPKPTPEPPDAVDINDPRIVAALAKLGPEEFILGLEENHEALIRKMAGELAHWAFSVGTGGGKSAKLQWLAVQMLMKRGTIIGVDPKMVSLKPLRGIPGVHLYTDPQNGLDMRRVIDWLAEVATARFYEKEQGLRAAFDPIYLILEESNELAVLLKQVWDKTRIKTGEDKESAADPIWRESVGKILRLGRDANIHIVAVFQDFKDNEFGGMSLVPLFRLKSLGNYEERQWKRIFGSVPMPPNKDHAGRMAVVAEGKAVRYQVPFTLDALTPPPGQTIQEASEAIYHQLYLELRERHGYEPDGLYTAPPANSPRGIPKLLQGRVSPPAAGTAETPVLGLPAGIVPGQRVTLSKGDGLYDTSGDGGGDALRDALGAILARHDGQVAGQADQAPAEPAEELLSLAEISRRLEENGILKPANTMSAHKRRRKDFPAGIPDEKGKAKYTYSEIYAYYEGRGELSPAAVPAE